MSSPTPNEWAKAVAIRAGFLLFDRGLVATTWPTELADPHRVDVPIDITVKAEFPKADTGSFVVGRNYRYPQPLTTDVESAAQFIAEAFSNAVAEAKQGQST